MQVLNIDAYAQVKRQIEYKGEKHDVVELTVQAFINNLKTAEDLEKTSKAAGADAASQEALHKQVENSARAVVESVPTLSYDAVVSWPIAGLHAALKFLRGELDPDTVATPGSAISGAEGGDEKKG